MYSSQLGLFLGTQITFIATMTCNWLTTGSCVHVLLYKDNGVDNLGQLHAIHVDVPQRSASVQIKRLKIASTLEDKMLELLDGKEPQSVEEAGVYIKLEDSLEVVGYTTVLSQRTKKI